MGALPMRSSQVVAVAAIALAVFIKAAEDIGYEELFEDSIKPVPWTCWDNAGLPSWLNGSFIIPSVGQFSFGGRKFKGTLDGFGKLHRFQLAGQQICERANMMLTGFYNTSMKEGTIAPGMLFDETEPPRPPCNVSDPSAPKYPSCNVKAPNDNTFVNTIKLGQEYLTITDSVYADHVDPSAAQVL